VAEWVVFDLDGTLISCAPRHIEALRLVAGLPSDRLDRIWARKREGSTTLEALVEDGVDRRLAERIADDWRAIIESPALLSLDTILAGSEASLRRCKSLGLRLALLTARGSSFLLETQLRRLGLTDSFDLIERVNPEHAAVEKSAVLRGLKVKGFFGDAESDARAAELAGVRMFLVSSGQRSPAFLSTLGPPVHADIIAATSRALSGLDHEGVLSVSATLRSSEA